MGTRQRKNVALRLAGRRVPKARVHQALQQVGLAERARHRPGQLSGGQQLGAPPRPLRHWGSVALARALITRPDVLFADEPTGALDTRTGREVLGLLRGMVDREGQTVVMVTHDPVAAACADRVLFLVDGRVHGELTAPSADAVAARMTRLEAVPC
ncbi:ABC-transporter ATP-binding protein [Streptomyces swartbergensis]|uniref:ABC-transporter ATP-binding protein n=1 Tax=Streptomyces swartbergensis TaxID=487165 RepID=A0A243RG51_9ACTN|nr:ABC-transporter ATP-binding protein [Streptomyces swartbergensis]